MRWHRWVVLIAGSTGSALRAVRPFQPSHHAGGPAQSRLRRKRDGFLVTLAADHDGPGHPRDLVGERDGSDLGGPPRQQRREPGTMLGAMDLGIANDDQRAGHEQAAQIAVTNWSDPEQRTWDPKLSRSKSSSHAIASKRIVFAGLSLSPCYRPSDGAVRETCAKAEALPWREGRLVPCSRADYTSCVIPTKLGVIIHNFAHQRFDHLLSDRSVLAAS